MCDDGSNEVPSRPEAYKAVAAGYESALVDTADPRYQAATAAAHKAGLTQSQFSQMLAFEAARVMSSQAKPAAAAPAAPAPRKIENYDQMSFAQKLALGGHL